MFTAYSDTSCENKNNKNSNNEANRIKGKSSEARSAGISARLSVICSSFATLQASPV